MRQELLVFELENMRSIWLSNSGAIYQYQGDCRNSVRV